MTTSIQQYQPRAIAQAGDFAPAPTGAHRSITVVVPTYRRSDQLLRCLAALERQSLQPAQVLVVVRGDDDETRAALARYDGAVPEVVQVERPGQTHALNSALRRAIGEVVAFTDDDAQPRPDWLERLAVHYSDPLVGGAGGKVIVPGLTERASRQTIPVGHVSAIGRPHGNHHLGDGPARDVQWLKGVNMSYRRELCVFDESLRGPGAQVANDSDVALRCHAAGWRIVYEPAAAVDHFAGPRFDGDGRKHQTRDATFDAVFNETLVLLRWLTGRRRWTTFAYLLLAGVPRGLGPVGAIKDVVERNRGPAAALSNCRLATTARLAAWKRWRRERQVPNPTPRSIA
jgi:glycosyltransferase involved in cell wall biosynthesis